MEINSIISLGSFLVAALAALVAAHSLQASKVANQIARAASRNATLDRRWLVLYGITQTAHFASDGDSPVDRALFKFFVERTMFAKQLGFSETGIAYIEGFQNKLERLKLLFALDQTEENSAEIAELRSWFFVQQRHAIEILGDDVAVDQA